MQNPMGYIFLVALGDGIRCLLCQQWGISEQMEPEVGPGPLILL